MLLLHTQPHSTGSQLIELTENNFLLLTIYNLLDDDTLDLHYSD